MEKGLKPGGLHLMFMGLAQTLNAGDELEVTLTLIRSGDYSPCNVKRPGEISSDGAHGEMKHGEGAHDHSGHDRSGHDHSGHDHSGHDHSGQDHSGHGS